jgi:SAM-dependent methyltransferase
MTGAAQTSWPLSWIRRWHGAFVHQRRIRVLAEALAEHLPQRATVLDIGCGDGTISALIAQLRPDVAIQGVEVMLRPSCKIACSGFDGSTLPFGDASFDLCMFVDVLHHTDDVAVLLREAARVARSFVVLKDHVDENFFDHATLRFMDWVGNRPQGVRLTYNYQSRCQWSANFSKCGLREASWTTEIPLYPALFGIVFGRKLHFVSLLKKAN